MWLRRPVLLIDEGAFSIPFLPGSLPLTAAAAPDRLVYVSYLKLCLKVPEVVEWTGHGRLYESPSLIDRFRIAFRSPRPMQQTGPPIRRSEKIKDM